MIETEGRYALEVTCRGCGTEFTLECGDKPPAKFLRTFASIQLCDGCNKTDAETAAERETANARDERVRKARLPRTAPLDWDEFDRATPDRFDRGRAIDAARDWALMDDPGGLMLFGGVGTGKTALAHRAALTRLDHRGLRWVSFAALVAQLMDYGDKQARSAASKALNNAGALVLDDFDKVNVTDWLASQLFTALSERIDAGAPLLLTTNLAADGISDTFGDSIASRIVGYCRVVEVPGPDYRTRR